MDYFRRIQYEYKRIGYHGYFATYKKDWLCDVKGLAKKKKMLRRWARRVLRRELKEILKHED